jgi:hypothetical protein
MESLFTVSIVEIHSMEFAFLEVSNISKIPLSECYQNVNIENHRVTYVTAKEQSLTCVTGSLVSGSLLERKTSSNNLRIQSRNAPTLIILTRFEIHR